MNELEAKEHHRVVCRVISLEAVLRELLENGDNYHSDSCNAYGAHDDEVTDDPAVADPYCECGATDIRMRAWKLLRSAPSASDECEECHADLQKEVHNMSCSRTKEARTFSVTRTSDASSRCYECGALYTDDTCACRECIPKKGTRTNEANHVQMFAPSNDPKTTSQLTTILALRKMQEEVKGERPDYALPPIERFDVDVEAYKHIDRFKNATSVWDEREALRELMVRAWNGGKLYEQERSRSETTLPADCQRAISEAGDAQWNAAIDACIEEVRDTARYWNDPGRLTEAERNAVVGALLGTVAEMQGRRVSQTGSEDPR